MTMIDAALMRGGTSRGVVLFLDDLAPAGERRDRQACALIGATTVDGLGGGSPVTNKVVLVATATSAGADLDYIVGNVSPDHASVDWSGTCGNMTSAVLPYAGIVGMLSRAPDAGPFMLRNLATGGLVEVEVLGGCTAWPTDGVEVRLTTAFLDPGGAVLGRTLPTGRPRDVVEVDGELFDFTLVDVTHPYLFLYRDQVVGERDLEAASTEARIERIRGTVCVALGRCAEPREAAAVSPAVPRVILLDRESSEGADVTVHAVSMGRAIGSIPVTSALAIAAALRIDGTVLGESHRPGPPEVRVGGPTGSITVEAVVDDTGRVLRAAVERTTRLLMRGQISLRS